MVRVLLTGGSGDLGQVLTPRLIAASHSPTLLDPRAPAMAIPAGAAFIQGSVLDRTNLRGWLQNLDSIVHIAAWHGIHESREEKGAYDFFDLNVRGTFETFEAATRAGIRQIVHISTTSLYRPDTLYARSKILAEQIARDYGAHHGMNVVILRPRGFIPHWNRLVYSRYRDWAQWFWKGAVHIDDVATAVLSSLRLLATRPLQEVPVLTLDSAYEFTDDDLANWDTTGPGTTFRRRYPGDYDLALAHDLDPARKPTRLDISAAERWIGYQPTYSLGCLLAELRRHGDAGPPRDGAIKRPLDAGSGPTDDG